ncbi:MAG TPA: L-threonylcarbamoyladenylate synthase, partial [Pirellulales bacterium]|nr:L-threonylcarbamoyladenylate synthase [Pirellulales bacterium]
MKTQVLTVDPLVPSAQTIAQAAAVLKAGGLVSFPTETVYGLGADALQPAAVGRIFGAKGRPAANPVIVHVAGVADVEGVAADWPAVAAELAARFWPGPLTLVVAKHRAIPEIVTAGGPTVAIRAPAHPVAQALIRAARAPIAAPSANASTHLSATRAEHVLRGLDGRIELLLDGGPTTGGLESTVLDVTVSPPRLLRPGLITPAEIEAAIGKIDAAAAARPLEIGQDAEHAAPLRSPGMMARHYAPRVPLECVAPGDREGIRRLCREHRRLGWLKLGMEEIDDACGVFAIEMPREPAAYAAQLYAALHTLEAANVERIIAT